MSTTDAPPLITALSDADAVPDQAVSETVGSQPTKRGPGRPKLGDRRMRQIAIRLTAEQMAAIERIRASRLWAHERGAIIRELVARGLKHYERSSDPKK